MTQAITPCIWLDNTAEEAANFYVSIFPNSKIIDVMRSASDTPSGPKGMVLTVSFMINNQEFMALNGGPQFKLSEAVSFIVKCKDQEEIDKYWSQLSAVPESEQCGWCKDKFGLSWQIVPENMGELVNSEAAMKAMLEMHKIDIEKLKEAANA